jgi:hypothetical protein
VSISLVSIDHARVLEPYICIQHLGVTWDWSTHAYQYCNMRDFKTIGTIDIDVIFPAISILSYFGIARMRMM